MATGGLDGEGGIENEDTIHLRAADTESTKIEYKSPTVAGFQPGLGYMPSPASADDKLAVTNAGSLEDVVDGALQWSGTVGDLALQAAVVGALGGEVSFFDQGRPGDAADAGVLGLVSLRLAF